MEIRLHNNDRLQLRWIHPDLLVVELYRPANMRDGHGLVLAGTSYLNAEETRQLVTLLQAANPAPDSPRETSTALRREKRTAA